MALFLSTFTNKIDKKGRVSVPATFRAALGTEAYQGIVAYPSFVNDCVEACGMTRMEHMYESIDAMDPFSEEREAFASSILGNSTQIPFDGDGRIVLPEKLIETAGVDEQAVFVGKGKMFEIWKPETFADHAEKMRELAKLHRSALRFSPKAGGVDAAI
ncbi:MAG: cell division/cell wall cluster transcriptional repressor MraZ [Rickettsiales bacterium]